MGKRRTHVMNYKCCENCINKPESLYKKCKYAWNVFGGSTEQTMCIFKRVKERTTMTDNWIPIDQAPAVDPLITGIHCDTRDFAVTYSYTTYTKKDYKEVYWILHGWKINDKFLIQQDEIIPWLKRIEDMAGGKAEWRCLNFTHITTTRGWLKYIRFYRYTEDTFVVCDWFNTPIDWRACSEETLEKECLNAH